MSNTQSGDFFGGLQDAIRENPVSAALVGMGVLWMFTGGAKLSTAAALLSPAARAAASGIGQGLQTSGDAVGAVAEGVRSAGSRVIDGVVDTISDAATSAGETARQAYEAAKDTAVDSTSNAKNAVSRQSGQVAGMTSTVQSNLKDTFERQPLLLGAIGIAIGAAMAAGLPSTQLEADAVGDAAGRVKAQVKDFASEQADNVTEIAKRTYDAVAKEAVAQDLTPGAAKEGAVAMGEKLKTVAKAARPKKSF
jgi:hypothetical protein